MGDGREPLIHLVIVCNRRLAREALAAYFSGQPGFAVLGHVATIEDLRRLCDLTRPQVAVVEVDQLSSTTVRTLSELRRRHSTLDVIVVFTTVAPEVHAEATGNGITALVPGAAGLDEMARMVRWRARRRQPPCPPPGNGRALTDRELAILSLMTAGHTTGDIAGLLRISPHTVDNHRRRIYTKLQVDNQSAAVSRTMSLGIFPPPWVASTTEPYFSDSAPELTTREQEILNHIADGRTTRQTARALGIAAKTVENTQARLYRKLGTHNRVETLTVAYRLGLIAPAART
jgi:DNA-binding NarL/FixJ family response regulator